MTVEKVEVGKSYRLIDKGGYFDNNVLNKSIFQGTFFTNDVVTLDKVDNVGRGHVRGHIVIALSEYEFFEEEPEEETTHNEPAEDNSQGGLSVVVDNSSLFDDKPEDMTEEDELYINFDPYEGPIRNGDKEFRGLSRNDIFLLIDLYSDGKIIQYKDEEEGWLDMDVNFQLCFDMDGFYRIKPEIE